MPQPAPSEAAAETQLSTHKTVLNQLNTQAMTYREELERLLTSWHPYSITTKGDQKFVREFAGLTKMLERASRKLLDLVPRVDGPETQYDGVRSCLVQIGEKMHGAKDEASVFEKAYASA